MISELINPNATLSTLQDYKNTTGCDFDGECTGGFIFDTEDHTIVSEVTVYISKCILFSKQNFILPSVVVSMFSPITCANGQHIILLWRYNWCTSLWLDGRQMGSQESHSNLFTFSRTIRHFASGCVSIRMVCGAANVARIFCSGKYLYIKH